MMLQACITRRKLIKNYTLIILIKQSMLGVKPMKNILTISLALLVSSCSMFAREFTITESETVVVDDQVEIHFYTMENITELSKSRMVQFRCEHDSSNHIMFGDVFIDQGIFRFSDQGTEAKSVRDGRL